MQKFPFILDEIGSEHRGRRFAIIIDEAHSSQGGRTSAAMSMALSAAGAEEDDETVEDTINRIMEARKMLPNASYFAFTATPKNKTLEIFGEAVRDGGQIKHRPFHSYTMKQAIQEGFILDVLQSYTPVDSYYRLIKTVRGDPEFDTKQAQKKLRRYVESHDYAIRLKAEIMVDHFHEQVIALNKIGGQARAMVVTSGIERAIQYYHAFRDYLQERKSPYQAIVAFSGEHEYGGVKVTEASLNGFPSNKIADRIQEDPYRFLICADKFQTGYDEPLLHTMYVDKVLCGIKAVQTLSRLNRAHPQKHDTFVLDFMNDADTIEAAFADYYRTTILSEETDPNKLHDLKADLDGYQVYAAAIRSMNWWSCISAAPIATSSIRSWMPAWRSTTNSWTRTGRWISRARPRPLRAPTAFLGSHPALHSRRVGEAVDLPELPHAQAARARGRRPVEGHSGSHRHGQLPGREESRHEDRLARRGRRDRAGADQRRRSHARTGAGPAEQHPQGLQRSVRHPIGRTLTGCTG